LRLAGGTGRRRSSSTGEVFSCQHLGLVIVLNYNGARWLERCLNSLRAQTIFDRIEVIVADNVSRMFRAVGQRMSKPAQRVFIQHGQNLGYCEGNNRAAEAAHGSICSSENDTWLEPIVWRTCWRRWKGPGRRGEPLVLNYDDDSFQSLGAFGYDLFGLASTRAVSTQTREVLMRRLRVSDPPRVVSATGPLRPEFFMFADELDLSWRV